MRQSKQPSSERIVKDIKRKMHELEKVWPSLKGALESIMVQSCHRNVHDSGDWVFWLLGQVKKYANHMREPHSNIHFCGEHTAIMDRAAIDAPQMERA